MNIYNFFERSLAARFYALLAVTSLILSAFPATFAEAVVPVDPPSITTQDAPKASYAVGEEVPMKSLRGGWQETGKIDVSLTSSNGGEFSGGNLSGDCNGGFSAVGSANIVSSADQIAFCYRNNNPGEDTITAVFTSGGDDIANKEEVKYKITVEGAAIEEEKKVDICHWNGHSYIFQNVSVNSLGNGHGNSGVNQGDIIPPTLPTFPNGFNWDWGESWLNNKCEDPAPQPIDVCPNIPDTQTEVPSGYLIDQSGSCVLEDQGSVDVCLNIKDIQETLPSGYEFVGQGVCEPTIDVVYGPYCGDGQVNQRWERCDGTEGCTEQCQPQEKNSCTDLTLVKINIENVENLVGGNGDMTDNLYVGGNTPIPNNVWFMVYWNGFYANDVDIAGYEDNPGLAVQRLKGSVRALMHGSKTAADEEHVNGTISFWSWDNSVEAKVVLSDSYGNNKLEGNYTDGSGLGKTNAVDDEVSVDNGVAKFWLTTTVADDGFYTKYSTPADCRPTQPVACQIGDNLLMNGSFERPVIARSWAPVTSVGWVTTKVIDNSPTTLEIWRNFMGGASDGRQNVELGGNEASQVTQTVATVPGATYELRFDFSPRIKTDLSENSVDALYDGNFLMNAQGDGSSLTQNTWTTYSQTFVALDNATDITLADVGTGPLGSYGSLVDNAVLCYVSGPEPETYRIDGYKYEYVHDSQSNTLAGWTINLYEMDDGDGVLVMSTTTDSNGYYYFEVEEGYYEVYEEMQENWQQYSVEQNSYGVEGDYCDFELYGDDEESHTCDFYNEYVGGSDPQDPGDDNPPTNEVDEDEEGPASYSSGTRTGRGAPAPQVLGVQTTSYCPFIEDYMQMGWNNDRFEVMKLQLFLNIFKSVYGGVDNPVTGFFGAITDANVKAFQEHFHQEVISPWFERGIVPHHEPTGFVYKTTLWKINSIVCPDYVETPSFEGENLQTNVKLNAVPVND